MQSTRLVDDIRVVTAASILTCLSPELRLVALRQACSFQPGTLDDEFRILGPLRAAMAASWDGIFAVPLNIEVVAETVKQDFDSLVGTADFDAATISPGHLVTFFTEFIERAKPRLEMWQRFRQQMRRLSCPGCGDDGFGF